MDNLALRKSVYYKKGLSGIYNLGNTCFVASILQCLSNTLKLTDYLLSGKYKNDVSKKTNEYYVLISYIKLLIIIWDENRVPKPRMFLENLGKIEKRYQSNLQEDSHEFLLCIMETLHKATSYQVEIEITGEIKEESDTLMEKALRYWQKIHEKEYSIMVELFLDRLN